MRYLFVVLALITVMGCVAMTPAQRSEIDALNAQMASAAQTIEELLPIKEKLDKALSALIVALKEKKIPIEQFNALSAIYREQNEVVIAKIGELKSGYADAQVKIKSLQESGISGWQIAGSMLLNILLGALGVRQTLKIGAESAQKNAIIVGVEKAGSAISSEVRDIIVNSISSTADKAGVGPALYASVKSITPVTSKTGE